MPGPSKPGSSSSGDGEPFGSPSPGESESFKADLESGVEINGTFPVKCIDVRRQKSKNDNPMWVWDFVVLEGPHAGEEVPLFTALTPSARWKLTESVVALGLANEDEEEVDFEKSEAIGKCALADISHQEGYGSSVDTLRAHPKGRGYEAGKPAGGPAPSEDKHEEEPQEQEEEEDAGESFDDDLPF